MAFIEIPDAPVATFAYRDQATVGIGDVTVTFPVGIFASSHNDNTAPLQDIAEALLPVLQAQYPGSNLDLIGITVSGVAQVVDVT